MTKRSQLPTISVSLSPSLLHLYEVQSSVVVIIDILRATSTIAAALYNGAKSVIPVDSVAECINLGRQLDAVTAGERDGRIAEGLTYGNSPVQYSREFINGRTLVLTTTNGTKLLHMALNAGAKGIITGAFGNIGAVCSYLIDQKKNVILACAGWKDKVNIEDTLFAGAVVTNIREHFTLDCDSAKIASVLYESAGGDLFEFIKARDASHFKRLMGYNLEEDIRYAFTENNANVLSVYDGGRLVSSKA